MLFRKVLGAQDWSSGSDKKEACKYGHDPWGAVETHTPL